MILQELDKLKRISIMMSIVLIAMGFMMILCPETYVPSLVSTLGYALLIISVVLILFFIDSKKTLLDYIIFTGALVLGLMGMAVLVFNDNMVRVIGVLFGAVQIFFGLIDMIHILTFIRRAKRKGWWVLVLLALLSIFFGVVVLINPWWNAPGILFDVIGIMLLFSSVVDIVYMIMIWPIKPEDVNEEGGK